ncbi:MAG: class A beta-lactamase [bacterium]|nr:class A beta-lactamase [bacterium]
MDGLEQEINTIISTKDAAFGIGIYDLETGDTVFINKSKKFVMMSVVKFPQAVAILKQVDEGRLDIDQYIRFEKDDLLPNMYSPLMDERPDGGFDLTLDEALSYTVSKSDNNVCDMLFKIAGGPGVVESYIQSLGFNNISIGTDYANMGTNTIYANQSSPEDMIGLLKMFYNKELLSEESHEILWKKLVETSTGPDQIKGLLPEGTIAGHKTGNTGADSNGVFGAFNDVGIVELPDGNSFAVVVFISDSKEDRESNARIIAEISRAAYDHLNK